MRVMTIHVREYCRQPQKNCSRSAGKPGIEALFANSRLSFRNAGIDIVGIAPRLLPTAPPYPASGHPSNYAAGARSATPAIRNRGDAMDAMLHVFEGVALLGALVVYLVPAMEADARNHEHALAITLVNVFLGWTLVGWFAALHAAHSVSGEKRIARVAMRLRHATAHATVDKIVAHARNCAPFQRQSKEDRRAMPGHCV
jgi:hypothetical protein